MYFLSSVPKNSESDIENVDFRINPSDKLRTLAAA